MKISPSSCSLLYLLFCCSISEGCLINQITNSQDDDWMPQISGSNIVWAKGTSSGTYVCLYDGVKISQIACGGAPQISDTNILWNSADGHLWYSDGKQQFQVTYGDLYQLSYAISDSYIAWISSSDDPSYETQMLLYNIKTDTTTTIATHQFQGQKIDISGSNLVWEQSEGDDTYIADYNISTGEIKHLSGGIASTDGGISPSICGSFIVWQSWNSDILLYDGQSTKIIGTGHDPDVSESYVVWEKNMNIYVYDIATGLTSQLTDNNILELNPKVSGSTVVWYGTLSNGNEEIFMATIPEPMTAWLLTMGTLYLFRNRKSR